MCRLLPGHCLFNALNGWATTVSYEVIGWMACHDVGIPTTDPSVMMPALPPPGSAESFATILTPLRTLVPANAVPAGSTSAPANTSTSPPSYSPTGLPVGSSPDPAWLKQCRASPQVQRKTTEFVTAILIVGGTLSALTSGFWGGYSDVNGRKRVIAVAASSEIVSNTGYLL